MFVTVGTQFHFDRLVSVALRCAADAKYSKEIVVQAGANSQLEGATQNFCKFMAINEFERYFKASDVIVSHAGMGNIISCLDNGCTGFFLARNADFGEHRNNHQIDTVRAFRDKFSGLSLYVDEVEFQEKLTAFLRNPKSIEGKEAPSRGGSAGLIQMKTELEAFLR